jgi:hypothetical protein
MAQNGKAYENEITLKSQEKKNEAAIASNVLSEDEQLELFAELIIDIYFDQLYEKEKLQQPTSRSA